MAPKRITEYAAITGANLADDDLLVAVDVSDVTMAPTGTEHKVRADELGVGVPRWDDLRVALSATKAGVTNAPPFDIFKGGVRAHHFSPDDQLFFDVQLPHDAKVGVAGAELRPHLHWSPGNSTNTGLVQWRLEVEWAVLNTAFATLSGSPLAGGQAGAGVAYQHQVSGFGTVDASGMGPSTVLMCRLYREPVGDTFGPAAFALSLDFHYQRRQFGTRGEFA